MARRRKYKDVEAREASSRLKNMILVFSLIIPSNCDLFTFLPISHINFTRKCKENFIEVINARKKRISDVKACVGVISGLTWTATAIIPCLSSFRHHERRNADAWAPSLQQSRRPQ